MDEGDSIWTRIANKRMEMLDPKNFGLMIETVQDSYNLLTGRPTKLKRENRK